MKKIYNNIIPLKGYKAITLWPWVFIRKSAMYDDITDRHEEIHGEQQEEMLTVGAVASAWLLAIGCGWWSFITLPVFLYWYGIEWIVKLCYYRNNITAYKNISFEREAYAHQNDVSYLDNRKLFAWMRFIKI